MHRPCQLGISAELPIKHDVAILRDMVNADAQTTFGDDLKGFERPVQVCHRPGVFVRPPSKSLLLAAVHEQAVPRTQPGRSLRDRFLARYAEVPGYPQLLPALGTINVFMAAWISSAVMRPTRVPGHGKLAAAGEITEICARSRTLP